jgi:ParB family chromosome partitioning protein
MNFSHVAIGRIISEGPNAGKFSFAFEPNIAALAESIKTMGLINPPLLREAGERLEIVCGHRRIMACKQLQFEKIPAFLYAHDELPDEKCLWLSLIDNEWSGRLSPIEKAITLQKFSEIGWSTERLVSEIAPHLGFPHSRSYIGKCLCLLSLEKEILIAIHALEFGVEQAFLFLSTEPESRLALFRVLQSCKANLNESRELISLIPDVAAIKNIQPFAFLAKEVHELISSEPAPRKRLQLLRDFLMKERYPRLSAAESKFKSIVGELTPDDTCRIDAPKNFEGNDITITLRAQNTGKLEEIIRKLSGRESTDKFNSLFSILHGRESV